MHSWSNGITMSNKPNEKMDGVLDNPSDKSHPAVEKRDKPARPPKARKPLGRETKVGLGVIGALLVILVIVLVVRMRGGTEDDLARQDANAVDRAPDKAQEKSKLSTSSTTSTNPKVIKANSANAEAPRYFGSATGGAQEKAADRSVYGGSLYSNNNSASEIRGNSPGYLPPTTPDSLAIDGTNDVKSTSPADASDNLENPLRMYGDEARSKAFDKSQSPNPTARSASDPTKGPADVTDKNTAAGTNPFGPNVADPFGRIRGAGPSLGNGVEASTAPSPKSLDDQENVNNIGIQGSQPEADTARSRVGATKSFADNSGDDPSTLQPLTSAQSSNELDPPAKSPDHSTTHSFAPRFTAPSDRRAAPPRNSTASASSAEEFGNARQSLAAADRDETAPSGKAKPPATLKAGEETANGELYTVQNNDTYWTIAEKTYGSGAYFKALYEHNRRQLEGTESLRAGVQLVLPDEATLRRLYPSLCPRPAKLAVAGRATRASATTDSNERIYVVRDGDTLYEIARRQLGKASRWAEVYELNRDAIGDATDRLPPGTRLVLPQESRNTRREQ
jgi:nucleoid-associated protein YgaU